MPDYDFDLFVIGAGSGGVRASRISAAYGARVAVAEKSDLGGTCVNLGCIPKKLFVYASHFPEDFEDARGYGWTLGPRNFDWPTLLENKNREISRLNGIYRKLLDDQGVRRIEGHARLLDAHTIQVDEQRFTADQILIATGSWPSLPEIPGIEHAISSNEAFHLETFPERVLVVGGGYIGVEFAGIFHGLGAQTTLLYRGPLFLRGFDDDMRTGLAEEMRRKGVDLRFEARVGSIERDADGIVAILEDGQRLAADQILYATGRRPLTADLDLEAAGVALRDDGAIAVDEFSRSNVSNIWAIGDVTDRINLTPVAIHEAMAFAATAFDARPTQPDHENVACAVFSQPTIGAVGLTEAQARARYAEIDVYRSRFRALKHTLSGQQEQTTMKLLVDRGSDRVVGAHMLGPEAAEIIQAVAIAIKCGATKAQFDATIGIHPTSAEEFVTMREPVR